jgi:hypothetical protein
MEGEEQEMAILASLTMPEDHDPVPYSDQFSTDRIFTKYIAQRQQLMWQDQPSNLNMTNLKPSETFVASFRGVGSLWRRFVYHDPNPQGLVNSMSLRDSETRDNEELYLDDDDSGQLNFNIAIPLGDYKPHGDQLVCGRTLKKYANCSWVSIDGVPDPEVGKESKVTFTWPGSFTIQACSFEIRAWRGNRFTLVDTVTFTEAQVSRSESSGNLSVTDYYSFFYVPGADATADNFATAGIQVSFATHCSVLAHVQVDFAYVNMPQLGPGCVRAASLRLTDMAPPLSQQGQCAVAATRENATWWEMYSVGAGGEGSVFKSVTAYRDSYVGPLRFGGYSFHLPKDMDDYRRQPYCIVNYKTGAVIDVWFDLEDQSTVNVYAANTQNTGANNGTTGQGADGWITVNTQWDGTTDNKWVDQWYPNVSYETWMHALEVMRGVPRVMSNRWHIKELMGALFKRGTLSARKYAGPLIRVAGRAAAEYLANQSPLAADGIKLLREAYGVGDAITKTLQNGH